MPVTILPANYPHYAEMFHDESNVLVGNALTTSLVGTAYWKQVVFQSPSQNGDSFTQSLFVAAGTYTLYFYGYQRGSGGKIDWYIDNALILAGQDWYANTAGIVIVSVSVTLTDGYHILKGIVNTRNLLSSGYDIPLIAMWVTP